MKAVVYDLINAGDISQYVYHTQKEIDTVNTSKIIFY